MAMLVVGLASVGLVGETANALGPIYSGPVTQSTGPAFFGPAPNPYPYCDSPTYFDPFEENVAPIGRMDVGDTATVTTDGITMDLEITSEGNPGTQYPGFFPTAGDGSPGDQPKGIELAEGDGATVTLSEPLFYSQWIFTDVDQPQEGFTVTPLWTVPGQAAAFGGDDSFTFAGSNNLAVELDDVNGVGSASEAIEGRVQVDFLGAVTGIEMLRTSPSSGQSGFAVGGGCEAAGAAKVVTAGPTWNGTAFEVTYELRVRNNLPSSASIQETIDTAIAAVGTSFVTDTPQGIDLIDLQLTDDLRDPAFGQIEVTSLTTDGGLTLNQNFDGVADFDLISSGSLAAESNEVITLTVDYTPDPASGNWNNCAVGYDYLNQTEVTGSAANVAVRDLSDDGFSAAPSDNNGAGGVDDPTPVNFPCPPGSLEIVKTVVPGDNATCPDFAGGIVGDGPALTVTDDDFVTYCISVRNAGVGPVTGVTVTDPQGLGTVSLGDLAAGETADTQFSIAVDIDATPALNTATATGTDVNGALPPVSDTALIDIEPKPQPNLEIVKTVVAGQNAPCPAFDSGVVGLGPALVVDDGDFVTYCLSVRNTGPGAATGVVLSDPQAPQDYNIGTLGTDEGATESYTFAVSETTPATNTAFANGSGPDGPLPEISDPAQIDVQPLEPALEIVKTVVDGADGTCPSFDNGVVGLGPALPVDDRDFVTYCISVRNVGQGIATDVTIADPQAGGASPFAIGTLASGATSTVQFNVQASLGVTPLVNTATAAGNGPTGALPEVTDQAQIVIGALPDPGLEIVKTAIAGPNGTCPDFAGGTAGEGAPVPFLETEDVTYCITVRNIGPGPATQVVIADDQAPNTFDLNIGDLAVGEEVTRSYDVLNVTVQTPTENIASASGQGLNGPVGPVSDPALISVSLRPDPVLEIVKTVVPGPGGTCPANFAGGTPGDGDALTVSFGDTVTYCVAVRNVGDGDATGVTVVDPQAPGDLALGTIASGEEASDSYDVVVDADTDLLNTATASGQGPNGPVGPVSDTAVITPADPVLEIVKTVVAAGTDCPAFADGVTGPGDALDVLYDDVVTYCVSVLNSGENPATQVVIADPQAPGGSIAIGTVGVGASVTESYDVVVDAATPLENVATATGQGPNGPLGPVSDPALISSTPQPDPVLEIVKTVVAGPGGTCPDFAGGTPGDGDALAVSYGDTVTYCISVRNVGERPATEVVVVDSQAPAPIALGTIAVGAEASDSYDVVADPLTPLTNTATASGQGPNGPVGPVSDTAVIVPDAAVLEIVKTVLPGANATCPDFAGGTVGEGDPLAVLYEDTVTYCITVRNGGGNAATDLIIEDPMAPGGTFEIDELAAGAEATESYNVIVDADTPATNVASVTGTGPGGAALGPVTDPAVIASEPQPEPNLEIVKTVVVAGTECPSFDEGTQGRGEALDVDLDNPVTYCVSIRNTGPGDATNVTVTDEQSPASPYDIGDLAAGEERLIQYDVVIGLTTNLINTAAVSGNGPVGFYQDDDDAQVNLIDTRVANVSLIHSVSRATEDCETVAKDLNSLVAEIEGTAVTWCAEVTNTGNVPLTNIILNAPTIGVVDVDLGAVQGVPALLPGESIYVPVPGAIPVGGQFSTGVVVADPSDEQGNVVTDLAPVTDTDDAETREAAIDLQTTVVPGLEGDCEESTETAQVQVGDDVTWCFVVTNTGTIDLLVEEVVDISLGERVPVPEEFQRVEPGESFTITTTSQAPAEDFVNEAEVAGQPLDFDGTVLDQAPVVEDSDPASIDTPLSDLAIEKTVSRAGPLRRGTPVTYTLQISNLGPDPALSVEVVDALPVGLEYRTVPAADGWVCALDEGERGFTCLRSGALESGVTETLSYVGVSNDLAPLRSGLTNVASVDSASPDPDPTNNEDTSTTEIAIFVTPPPPTPDPPVVTPDPPEPEEPDEVLGLAITGSSTDLLALISAALMAVGGLMTVGSRRKSDGE